MCSLACGKRGKEARLCAHLRVEREGRRLDCVLTCVWMRFLLRLSDSCIDLSARKSGVNGSALCCIWCYFFPRQLIVL